MANDLDLRIRISAELADVKSAIADLRKQFDGIGASARASSSAATSGLQGVTDAVDEIIASLKREADLFGKSSQEAKLYEMALRGATQAEMAEAKAIVGTIDSLKRKQAADREAAAAEANRQGSIKKVIAGLNEEVSALGKTSKELTLYKLQQLGASDAELKHARSLIEQKEAYERVNSSAGGLNGTLRSLAVSAAAFFSVQGAVSLTGAIARITDDYQNMASRLRIATGEGEAFAQTQQALFGIAQKTSNELGTVTELYTTLARTTKNVNNVSGETLVRLTDIVGKLVALSGSAGPAAQAAIVQFGQALNTGFKGSGQEIQSIIEQAPRLAEAIERGAGFAAGSLKQMAADGELSAEIVVNAILKMGDEADREFGQLNDTVGKAMTRLKNDINNNVGQTDMSPLIDSIDDLRETINDPATKEGIVTLASGLTTLASWAVKAASAFGDMGRELGYLAAQITGNVSELDELEQQLKAVDRAASLGGLRKFFLDFRSDEELQKIKETLQAQRDALETELTGSTGADRQAREAAAAEEKARKLKEQAEAELAAAQAAQEKARQDEEAAKAEEKRQQSIQGILDNLTEQAATEGRSAEEAVNYQLSQLGATEADRQRAAALSQQIAAIKAKGEADKEAQKRAEEAAKADEKAAEARKKLLEDVARDTEQLQIELLKMEGKGAEARTREIEIKYRDMMNRMKQAGDTKGQALIESLISKEKVKIQFDEVRRQFDELLADLKAKEESYANRVRIGDLTQAEADRLLDADRAAAQGQGGSLIDQAQGLANANPNIDGLQGGVDDMIAKTAQLQQGATGLTAAYQDLSNSLTQMEQRFATTVASEAVNGLTNLFVDLVNGTKSAKEAFAEFARSMVQSMLKMAAQWLATWLILQVIPEPYRSAVVGISGMAGKTGAGVNHTGGIAGQGGTIRQVNPALFAAAPRYHTGGVAGLKPGEVPAILKKGEEVLTESDPRHVANGGGQQAGGGTRVINVIDPNMVADYMSSSQGEQVLLNVLQRNSGSIKQTMMG